MDKQNVMEKNEELISRYEADPTAYFDPVELDDIFHTYAEESNFARLQEVLQRAKELHPEDLSTIAMEAEYALNLGDARECLTLLDTHFDDDNPFFCILKAGALAKLGQTKEAVALAEKAVERGDDPMIPYDIGVGFMNAEEPTIALRYFMRSHEYLPDDLRTLLGILYCLNQVGEKQDILHFANLALEIDSFCLEAWMAKGGALMDTERYDEAIECYDYAIAIQQDWADPYMMKANCLVQTNKHDEALACGREALAYAEGEQKAHIHLMLMGLYQIKEDAANATEHAIAALECAPTLPEVLQNAIHTLVELDCNDYAIPFLEQQYREGSRDINLLTILAEAYGKTGQFRRSIDIYKELYELTKKPSICALIGAGELSAGNFNQAYQQFQKAMEGEPLVHTAVFMTVCAHEMGWDTAAEDNFIIAYCMNKEKAIELVQIISEDLFHWLKSHRVLARAEKERQKYRDKFLNDNTIQ